MWGWGGGGCILKCRQGGVQFSYEIILGGYGFYTPHFSEPPPGRNKRSVPNSDVISHRASRILELLEFTTTPPKFVLVW